MKFRQQIKVKSFSIICEHIRPGSGPHQYPGSFSSPETSAGTQTIPCQALHKPLELINCDRVKSTEFNSVDFKLSVIFQTETLLFDNFVNLLALGGTSALIYLFAFATNQYRFMANLCNKTDSLLLTLTELQM